eukprot:9482983-Pyramimonas_sp.AAC.1
MVRKRLLRRSPARGSKRLRRRPHASRPFLSAFSTDGPTFAFGEVAQDRLHLKSQSNDAVYDMIAPWQKDSSTCCTVTYSPLSSARARACSKACSTARRWSSVFLDRSRNRASSTLHAAGLPTPA